MTIWNKMMTTIKKLTTPRGDIQFPAYIPVTTFGNKYPLDNLIRPYLPRLAPAVMVSMHYAKQMKEKPSVPVMIDSGGFASLFKNSKVVQRKGLGVIEIKTDDGVKQIHPMEVLDFQEKNADVAFTLDFIIPPGMDQKESKKRMKLTIANAQWAIQNRRRKDMSLFACIQAWDPESAREYAQCYKDEGFDGVAIGGLVPRAKDTKLILEIVSAVRAEIPDLPIHVFGLGKPEMIDLLYANGVDSVDSSSYVKMAAQGKLWNNEMKLKYPSPSDRLHLALCNLAFATSITLPLSTSSSLLFKTKMMKECFLSG